MGDVGPLCCIGADFSLCLGASVGGGSSGCCFCFCVELTAVLVIHLTPRSRFKSPASYCHSWQSPIIPFVTSSLQSHPFLPPLLVLVNLRHLDTPPFLKILTDILQKFKKIEFVLFATAPQMYCLYSKAQKALSKFRLLYSK